MCPTAVWPQWRELRVSSYLPLPRQCLITFPVFTAALETCTTTEPWVCSSNTSPTLPPSPSLRLLASPCEVSILLRSTQCLFCQWQENWQLLPTLKTQWFRQGSNLSDQGFFLHASLSQLSRFPNVICFVSHTTIAFLGHGDFHRYQIGCSWFAHDCFCMFLVCLIGYPNSIVPTELPVQDLHLL